MTDPEVVGRTWTARSTRHKEDQYWCHGLDLRHLLRDEPLELEGLCSDVPTLLVSEMCLCYLEADETTRIINYFADRIPNLAIVLYEPIKPDDPFGQQMVSNLAVRRIRIPTLEAYKHPADQERRLVDAGFETVQKLTIEDIWNRWVQQEEKERLDELEQLDEVEEWNLLADHYIVVWGWRGSGFEGLATL